MQFCIYKILYRKIAFVGELSTVTSTWVFTICLLRLYIFWKCSMLRVPIMWTINRFFAIIQIHHLVDFYSFWSFLFNFDITAVRTPLVHHKNKIDSMLPQNLFPIALIVLKSRKNLSIWLLFLLIRNVFKGQMLKSNSSFEISQKSNSSIYDHKEINVAHFQMST